MTTAAARGQARPRPRLYFAYGSNLDVAQMVARCPAARLVGKAALPGHTLAFAGYSARRAGAVATVVPCGGMSVPGVVFALTPADLTRLDGFEGAPGFYRRYRVMVWHHGRARRAVTYLLLPRWFRVGLPGPAYLGQIAAAYRAHGLPAAALRTALDVAIAVTTEASE